LRWYKNAIIYCLSVGTYMDANGDGIGDFQGLMRRLDYLHGLGVTAVWLMPFQVSPLRDDGYDVAVATVRLEISSNPRTPQSSEASAC
jgi:maltose alpha-D-glucosyltransferase / alpha-amylase